MKEIQMNNSKNSVDTSHYNKEYFAWQKAGGAASGILDNWKFKKYADNSKTILDFGCGGGYILEKLPASKKYGVEINPSAREEAGTKGITVFDSIQSIPADLQFDVIISHHALEHVHEPLRALQELKKHLKSGGVITFVLPFNDWRNDRVYNPDDINKHLYTWSPLLIGNLFSIAGYTNIQTKIIKRAGIPWGLKLKSRLPAFLYNFLCWARSMLQNIVEVQITASV